NLWSAIMPPAKKPRRPDAPCRQSGTRAALNGDRELFLAQIYRRGLALLAALELEAELLAFPQIAHPRPLNGRNVNEDILGAVVGLNKTIALLRIEPLYRTRSHSSFPSR